MWLESDTLIKMSKAMVRRVAVGVRTLLFIIKIVISFGGLSRLTVVRRV